MKERLKEFLGKEGFNSKTFALKIGVQPSSISHILTGRNKPSIEFLEKLLNAYPDMDIKYLITGMKSPKNSMQIAQESLQAKETEVSEALNQKRDDTNANSNIKQDKVLVLHSDGTYSEYSPR